MFRLQPTEKDIENIKAVHKEKKFHDFSPIIAMTLPLYKEDRYQVLADLPITERQEEKGEYLYFHKGVPFGTIDFGTNGYQKYHLYAVQVMEQLYLKKGRNHHRISERPLQEFRLIWTRQQPTKKSLYRSLISEVSILYADSLEGLRTQYTKRFVKN